MAEIASMAQRLRTIRRTFGLTQENMAAKVNLALSTWQSYEAEVGHKPRSDVLERLVDWGVDADYILTGRGNPLSAPNMIAGAELSGPKVTLDQGVVWNVAYYLAENSPLIDAEPILFADTVVDTSRWLTSDDDADDFGKIVELAVERLKRVV